MGNPEVATAPITNKWDKVLEGLTSDKIYKDFDKDENTGNYNKDCEQKIIGDNACPDFQKICKKFARNLEDIFCKKHGGNTVNYCILLKYWVYEQIKKICKSNENNIKLSPFTDKLKNVQYSIEKRSPVKFECYDYYNDYTDNWKDEKELYEYFINFDEINTRIIKKENGNGDYKEYVEHIRDLYKEKKDKGCCKIKYYHLCDHYFRCDPRYDPEVLLSKLKGSTGEKVSSVSGKHGIDISEEIAEQKKYKYEDEIYIPTGTDVVIPNVPLGWHKRKDKSKSRIQNVRCIMNYAAQNSKYALVSCYNFEKGYPDLEHIFRPTKEEEVFYSKLKENKEQGHYDNLSSSLVHRKSFPKGSNKNVKAATEPNITAVMPAWMHGYSPLGELIREKQSDYTVEPQKSRALTYTYAPIARSSDLNEGEFSRIPCIYIKINEKGEKECVKKEDLNKIQVFTNQELQNLGTEETVATSPATDSHADESLGFFETIIGDSMFKTPMFRGATLAVLLAGMVFVFFIYYKVYDNYKMCAYIN
ncbi:variable surface protein Vir12g [Plasmodium vivax North Korean]|uniref:Variable surface protein Vir12g n=1 Tax=Plasmodium vivax North Korean TaxID=1035514 RepID=A0A0J9TZA4_PLAVI|nr:variable surface protein Vir12g [Plasmodium vivax North Korean]